MQGGRGALIENNVVTFDSLLEFVGNAIFRNVVLPFGPRTPSYAAL